MLNKILKISLIILIIVSLSILFKDINLKDVFASESRFITVQGYNVPGNTCIIVDTETKVMYLWHEDYYKGGLTVMLDSEGKPLLCNN